GWTTMGEVQVGDQVFDERGTPCTVMYKSPVFVGHDCYEVVFDDGSTIVADADHLWETWDHRAWKSKRTRPATRTTREIAGSLHAPTNDQRPNHRIEVAGPLDLPEAELPLDPYLLGLWLGDGHTGRPQITTMDSEIVAAFEADGWTLVEAQPAGQATTYVIRHDLDEGSGLAAGQIGGRPMLRFTRVLRDIGLCASRPEGALATVSKHIPGSYLRASEKQRVALLQGLMDTDGCVVKGQTTCQIALSHRPLIEQVRELVLSLGIKAGPVKHKRSNDGTDVWTMNFSAYVPVFRLRRRAEAQRVVDPAHSKPRWRMIVDARPVASVPTQCITVDSPSHLYLAGREMIPTHNTAFALGMACNSAMKDRKPVLIFTLEMSQLELSQRLLCSEALVDSGKVKTGRLEEAEWTRISHAVGRLAEAPIYIDDNPHTSIMDIRAKARRLKSREGDLGMIVIDYIQLMSGRSNAESRQVEVSEISRNLKILARELEAPVIALAQLNRSLEQRTDKRPMLSDLRESGCLPAATRILRADNGQEVTIGELVLSEEQPLVWSMDARQRMVPMRMTKVFPTGIKPVYRMRLASGRSVEATANHLFFTVEGWKPLGELEPGAVLATPGRVGAPVAAARELVDIATSDLYWDQVTSIEPVGEMPTFDATVPGTHNFVADGIV
ncbi:MAG: AAA family ATPase, partial [Acidimicrobiia bacterium]|nr:AAA family ATPase [Acidimicrobiia bacterium]